MRAPRFPRRVLRLLLAAAVALTLPAAAELVDQVVATVGTAPVLESDLELARIVHLVPVENLEPAGACREIFDGRLRLEIQYRDLEASGIVYRLKIDRDAVVRELTKRAGGPDRLRAALKAAGLGMEDVRELALEVAAVNAYVNQRLRPRVRVSLEEMRRAYQESLVLEIAARGGEPPPFEKVRDQIHRLLVERKLNGEIRQWIREARSRLQVTLLVDPARLAASPRWSHPPSGPGPGAALGRSGAPHPQVAAAPETVSGG